ncbi:MAG: CCA tRNA nucleotidyltransferase [Candidatus Methylomirabilia bacterium]
MKAAVGGGEGHTGRPGAGASAGPSRQRRSSGAGGFAQVDPGALGLSHRAVRVCSREISVREMLPRLQRQRAPLLVIGGPSEVAVAWPGDLRRAQAFGLGARRVREIARWGIPVVGARTSEATMRRLLREGAPALLVRERRGVIGALEPQAPGAAHPPLPLTVRLERRVPPHTRDLLREVGRLADSLGVAAYVVGGFVRDLLRGAPTQDLDLVVEGSGLALARRLASQLGAKLTAHQSFGTASVEGWGGGRVDLATARRERYATAGALPSVSPGSIAVDLARRDFTINAMALAISGSGFGPLLDLFGGRADLRRRRIRTLHPLSFVEDPTRAFRAVRYAIRFGFALDRQSRRTLALALEHAPYAALSGQRLRAELELIMAEPGWGRGLLTLGRLGVLRLIEPSYRFSRVAIRRVQALGQLLRWGRAHGIALDPLPLAVLTVLGHLQSALAERGLRRLALTGEPLARLVAALREGPDLARRLEASGAAPASQRASLLRGRPMEVLAFAWIVGSGSARRQVQWFLAEGRRIRPLLSGDELLALGVSGGPQMSQLLHRLRDERLDRGTLTREEEIRLVKASLQSGAGNGRPPHEAREVLSRQKEEDGGG